MKNILEKLQEYGFNKARIFKHNDLVYDLMEHGTIEAAKQWSCVLKTA